MSHDVEPAVLELLREIRDGQREIVGHLAAQRALAEEQLRKSQERVEASMALQREALRRQRSASLVALPGIVACVVAIAYLVWRYF